MKKFLLGLLSMMFSCALALGVSSCGGKGKDNDSQTMTENVFSGNDSVDSENSSSETEKPLESESSATHVCVFDDWYETKGAKCEEEGEERRDCTCGNYETRPIVQTGHSFTAYKSNNDAECEKDGTKTATCDNGCGKTETLTDEGSATGHTYKNGVCACGKEQTSEGLTFEYLASEGGYVLADIGACNDSIVKIPASYKDKPVVGIEVNAFSFRGVTEVIIPDSVVYIAEKAFESSFQLEKVHLGNGVKRIGAYAFSNCTNLTVIIFGTGLETIGDYAFESCEKLSSVRLPDSVKTIGECAFSHCDSLTNVTIGKQIETLGMGIFESCRSLTIVIILGEPKTVDQMLFGGRNEALKVLLTTETLSAVWGEYVFHEINVCLKGDWEYSENTATGVDFYGEWQEYKGANCKENGEERRYLLSDPEKYQSRPTVGTHDYVNGNCGVCGIRKVSEGLLYTISADGSYYSLSGLGSCKDEEVYVADTYEGKPVKAIADNALSGRNIKTVLLPDGVTSIGNRAFANSEIESIDLNNVTQIGESAFEYCCKLQTVVFGNTLKTIGKYAFYNCEVLSEVELPDSVISIEENAFWACKGIKKIVLGKGLQTLGKNVFLSCSSLAFVIIKGTPTQVGWSVFANCKALNTVLFESETKPSVWNSQLSATVSVYLKGDWDYVDESETDAVFYGEWKEYRKPTCTLEGEERRYGINYTEKYQTKPIATVEHIYTNYAFNNDATCQKDGTKTALCNFGCGEKDTLTAEGTVSDHVYTNYQSNKDATCEEDGTKTAACDFGCGETETLADKGSALGHSYTNHVSNGDATCTEDGTKTATCANGCGETETLPDENTALGHSYTNHVSNNDATCTKDGTKTATCDNGCGEKETLTDENTALGHSYTNYVSNGDATCTKDGTKTATCANGCGETETLPDENTALGHSFTNYVSNGDKTCTKDGTKTATCANGCGEKDTLVDEAGHQFVDSVCSVCGITDNINGLIFQLNKKKTEFSVISKAENITTVFVPAYVNNIPVTRVEHAAFMNEYKIEMVIIPNTVTSIGFEAFMGCSGLRTVILGNGLERIEPYAFDCNDVITSVYYMGTENDWNNITIYEDGNGSLLNAPREYGNNPSEGLLYSWQATRQVYIVTGIGSCTDTVLNIPKWYEGKPVTGIANNAFLGNATIKEVIFSNAIMELEYGAFRNCTSLEKIVLPDSITSLGEYAFAGCTGAISLQIGSGIKKISSHAFYQCAALTEIVIPSTVSTVGSYAFACCSKATSLTMENVNTIYEYAFWRCLNIKAITIPNSVTGMGNCAFQECMGAQSLSIGLGLTTLPAYTFAGCTSLTNVVIPNTVTYLSEHLFFNCTSLRYVTIGTGVNRMEPNLFKGCTSLLGINMSVISGWICAPIKNDTIWDTLTPESASNPTKMVQLMQGPLMAWWFMR